MRDSSGMVRAGELNAGDRLLTLAGKWLPVERLDVRETPTAVFNLMVAEAHTYYAGKSQVLVHNECGIGKWKAAEFEGRRVYQREDLFNPMRKSRWWDESIGDYRRGTNIERMEAGHAPIGKDSRSVNLHHLLQEEPGAVAEVSSRLHRRVPHKQLNPGESFRNNPALLDQFEQFRGRYWQNRGTTMRKRLGL